MSHPGGKGGAPHGKGRGGQVGQTQKPPEGASTSFCLYCGYVGHDKPKCNIRKKDEAAGLFYPQSPHFQPGRVGRGGVGVEEVEEVPHGARFHTWRPAHTTWRPTHSTWRLTHMVTNISLSDHQRDTMPSHRFLNPKGRHLNNLCRAQCHLTKPTPSTTPKGGLRLIRSRELSDTIRETKCD